MQNATTAPATLVVHEPGQRPDTEADCCARMVKRGAPAHLEPPGHLTPRQVDVLRLLCEGLPNKLICRRLGISAGTVKAHISSILRELGVTSRLQAVVEATRGEILAANIIAEGARWDIDAERGSRVVHPRECAKRA